MRTDIRFALKPVKFTETFQGDVHFMKPAYLVGGLLAVVFIAIAVYYAIPSFTHVLTADTAARHFHHYKHAALFGGLAVLSLVGAWFLGNSSSAKTAA
jgi:hypothetical protein